MGIHRGPNSVNDGLVFGYDTGYGIADNTTPTRFYPGKSTTNLLTSSGAQSLDVRSDIYYNVTKTDLGNGKYRFVNDGTGGTTIRVYANVNDLVDGQYYGCSVSYEELNAGGYIHLDWCDTTNTSFTQASYGSANRIHIYGARSTYNSTFRFLDISLPVNGSVVLFDAQIESGTPSPFVNGTRSSTASLIDLKRTTSVDVSNVSFDSTGQPTFDGSNDYITIPGSSGITSNAKTVEIMFKMNGSYANFSPLAIYANGSSATDRIWLGMQNSKFRMHGWGTVDPEGTTTISADEWYVCTFSYDKSTQAMKVYTNGVLETSTTNTQGGVTASSSLNWYLGTVPGGWQSVTYSDVDIPIFKLYNRILSDSEVKQNYNAYKNRFDI